jgi:hypothetical protein
MMLVLAISFLASALGFAIKAHAAATGVNALSKRNVCDGKNASPILYKEYHSNSCPPKNKLNPDGSCQGQEYLENDCVSFCQVLIFSAIFESNYA